MGVNRSKVDQYQLRLPPGLRDQLKEAADKFGRSLNQEIVARLTEYGGAAEADKWKARHDQLHVDYDRLQALYEDEKLIIEEQRHNMSEANVWQLRHLRSIVALCDILLSLDSEPSSEIISFATRMREAAAKSVADFEGRPALMASIQGKKV